MDTSFTWRYLTAAGLALQLTREERAPNAGVNTALVVTATMNHLEMVVKKVAAPVSWLWMRPLMQFAAAPD